MPGTALATRIHPLCYEHHSEMTLRKFAGNRIGLLRDSSGRSGECRYGTIGRLYHCLCSVPILNWLKTEIGHPFDADLPETKRCGDRDIRRYTHLWPCTGSERGQTGPNRVSVG